MLGTRSRAGWHLELRDASDLSSGTPGDELARLEPKNRSGTTRQRAIDEQAFADLQRDVGET